VNRRSPPRKIELTEPDLDLLRFLAEHRLVVPEQAAVLLERSPETARARLGRLETAGYVRSERLLRGRPAMHLITRTGLRVVGSTLEPPRVDVRACEHDVGVAWLWLAARGGTYGPLQEIIAERRLRSHDGSRGLDPDSPEPLGVRLGGYGARGQEHLHYPDLLLRTADGRRIALELELSPKNRTRLEGILVAYGADPRIDGVVYLVDTASVARSVARAARRLGVSSRVHVQRVRLAGASPSAGRGHFASRAAPSSTARAPAPTAYAPARTARTPAPTAHAPVSTDRMPAPVAHGPARTARTPAPVAHAPARTARTPAPVAHAPARTARTPAWTARAHEVAM
jgi:hypothetical protein